MTRVPPTDSSLPADVGALFGHRGLHQQHEGHEHCRQHGAYPKDIKVSQRSRLLLAYILERLRRHLLRTGGIAGQLVEKGLRLLQEGTDRRVQRVEKLTETP